MLAEGEEALNVTEGRDQPQQLLADEDIEMKDAPADADANLDADADADGEADSEDEADADGEVNAEGEVDAEGEIDAEGEEDVDGEAGSTPKPPPARPQKLDQVTTDRLFDMVLYLQDCKEDE